MGRGADKGLEGGVPDEPYEAFGRSVLLRLEFVNHKLLEGF